MDEEAYCVISVHQWAIKTQNSLFCLIAITFRCYSKGACELCFVFSLVSLYDVVQPPTYVSETIF